MLRQPAWQNLIAEKQETTFDYRIGFILEMTTVFHALSRLIEKLADNGRGRMLPLTAWSSALEPTAA